MNFFSRLEKSLEEIIEGAILSRFRTRIQPIEIARTLWNEIRANKRVSVQGTYVPNFFLVTLSDSDFNFLEPIRENVEMEIIEHLETECDKRDFETLGPMVIRWMKDIEGREGEFFISSDFVKDEELPRDIREKLAKRSEISGAVPPVEQKYDSTGGDTIVKAPPINEAAVKAEPAKEPDYVDTLEMDLSNIDKKIERKFMEKLGKHPPENITLTVTEGFDRGRKFIINKDESIIGRDESCDITINDPGVSRKHAVLTGKNDVLMIKDLESRSGLFVNDQKIDSCELDDGDKIKIGITVLQLRTS